MSCASSAALDWASMMIRLRVRNMRPHDATPTVTATLTAISQILVRIVTWPSNLPRNEQTRPHRRELQYHSGPPDLVHAIQSRVFAVARLRRGCLRGADRGQAARRRDWTRRGR